MASEKKTYETHEERLINGNAFASKGDDFSMIRELFSRIRCCESEILRLQCAILSVADEESLKKMKERWNQRQGQ